MIAVSLALGFDDQSLFGIQEDDGMFQSCAMPLLKSRLRWLVSVSAPSPTTFVTLQMRTIHGPGNEEANRVIRVHGEVLEWINQPQGASPGSVTRRRFDSMEPDQTGASALRLICVFVAMGFNPRMGMTREWFVAERRGNAWRQPSLCDQGQEPMSRLRGTDIRSSIQFLSRRIQYPERRRL